MQIKLSGIPHETTKQTGILHKDGTISMARLTPGTACTEFFIVIGTSLLMIMEAMPTQTGKALQRLVKL